MTRLGASCTAITFPIGATSFKTAHSVLAGTNPAALLDFNPRLSMAKAGSKRLVEENSKRLALLLQIIVGTLVLASSCCQASHPVLARRAVS